MRVAVAILTIVLGGLASGSAVALEPWVAPEVARACPRFGPGFIEVPGSTTCIRIGGRVRADYDVGGRGRVARERIARADRIGGFGTSARLTVEARTETELGPLRLICRMDAGEGRFPRR
jgi:hypothetical protein